MQHREHQHRSADFSVGQTHEFLGAFGRKGGSPLLLSRVTDDNAFMKRVVNFMALDGWAATTSQQIAAEIMASNNFGIGEAIKYFGVKPTESQLHALAEVPFTEGILRECGNTHILVAFFPHSIYDIWEKEPSLVSAPTAEGHPYEGEPFAKKRGEIAGWHLIQKTPAKNSLNMLWDGQLRCLGEDNLIPAARVLTYAAVGHYRNTGERLFKKVSVGCSDTTSDGCRARVGYFGERECKFCITNWHGEPRESLINPQSPTIGIAAERKPTYVTM